MLLLLVVLLALAGAGVGVYIAGNGGGSHDVSFLGQNWTGVDSWLPPLVIAATFAALALLAVVYGWARIGMLKHGSELLRSELARARGVADAATATAAAERERGLRTPDSQYDLRRRRWFGIGERSRGDRQETATAAVSTDDTTRVPPRPGTEHLAH